jgi:hypothetical protein
LLAEGKTVWGSSTSLTGTYSAHVSRGNYLSLSLGYVRGPAISPRVADTLTFTANWSLYLERKRCGRGVTIQESMRADQ